MGAEETCLTKSFDELMRLFVRKKRLLNTSSKRKETTIDDYWMKQSTLARLSAVLLTEEMMGRPIIGDREVGKEP